MQRPYSLSLFKAYTKYTLILKSVVPTTQPNTLLQCIKGEIDTPHENTPCLFLVYCIPLISASKNTPGNASRQWYSGCLETMDHL